MLLLDLRVEDADESCGILREHAKQLGTEGFERGKLGELRLSIYDDNDWRRTTRLLAAEGVRFGVNLLVLPERLPALEALVLEIVALGCTDVLLLSPSPIRLPGVGTRVSGLSSEDLYLRDDAWLLPSP